MKGELWLWLGIGLMAIGIVSGVKDGMKAEYARGYKAGADSLTTKQVDDVCVQWLFESNLIEAKKRVCGK
jgi:hypothetical protein